VLETGRRIHPETKFKTHGGHSNPWERDSKYNKTHEGTEKVLDVSSNIPMLQLVFVMHIHTKKKQRKKMGGNDSHLHKANIPCSNSTIKNRSGWMMIFHQLPPIPCLSNFTV